MGYVKKHIVSILTSAFAIENVTFKYINSILSVLVF